MPSTAPHYLLFSEASLAAPAVCHGESASGRWKFVLEAVDGSSRLEAADEEELASGERLALLAVVRGLEAVPQPSRVTLVTASRYVSRGLRFALAEWRENEWQWEHFGQMLPVKNADLWKRVDAATRIHTIQCRTLRFDAPHRNHSPPAWPERATAREHGGVRTGSGRQQREPNTAPRPRNLRSPPPSLLHQCARRAAQLVYDWLRRTPSRAAQLI